MFSEDPSRAVSLYTAEQESPEEAARGERDTAASSSSTREGGKSLASSWTGRVWSQTLLSTFVLNANSRIESASAPSEPGLALNYTLQDSSTTNDTILPDQRPDNASVLSHNQLPDISGSPFHRPLRPANSSTTINTDAGGSRASPHGTSFEHGTMAVDYSNTTRPPVISPGFNQFRASSIASASDGPARHNNNTDVLQVHKQAFTVNSNESAVCDPGLM